MISNRVNIIIVYRNFEFLVCLSPWLLLSFLPVDTGPRKLFDGGSFQVDSQVLVVARCNRCEVNEVLVGRGFAVVGFRSAARLPDSLRPALAIFGHETRHDPK